MRAAACLTMHTNPIAKKLKVSIEMPLGFFANEFEDLPDGIHRLAMRLKYTKMFTASGGRSLYIGKYLTGH